MSNHPPPLAGLGGTPSSRVDQTVNARSVVSSATASMDPGKNGTSVPSSAMRDELVRAMMPELRLLMQHLIDAAVERSIAPLLDKQRELEATLKEVRSAQVRAEQSSGNGAARHAPGLATTTGAAQVRAQPFAIPAAAVVSREAVAPSSTTVEKRSGATTRAEAIAGAAYDANALADIPLELNGSRRKKVVVWAFAVAMVVLLLSAVGLSVLSNMGTYL